MKTLVNHKITVPENEIYEFKYDINSSNLLGIGESQDKLEYAVYTLDNGLIIFTNPGKREVWSNREPHVNVTDGKTIVTYD